MRLSLAVAALLAAGPVFAAPTTGRDGASAAPPKQEKNDDTGSGSGDFGPYPPGSLAAPPVTKPGGGKPVLLTYSRWRDTPRWHGHGNTEVSFNTGPGTTFAVGFTAGPHATFAWVESVESTDNCTYKAWLSEAPGGQPLKGKACAPIETNYTGGNLHFSSVIANKVEAQYVCPVVKGERYYFNLQLLRWGPNPYANNVYSCVEHVLPQGDAGSIFAE